MKRNKLSQVIWRQAAPGLLLLSLCLGMTTARAAGGAAIAPLAGFDPGAYPAGLVVGPDQSVWASLSGSGEIGQASGTSTTTYPLPNPSARPLDITIGADRALWFSFDNLNQIGRMAPGGAFSDFSLGEAGASANGLALGQDLALWFTEPEGNCIGRLTTDEVLTEFTLPQPGSRPMGIASAQNGDLWFVEWGGYRLGKITLQGLISEYDLPNRPNRPVDLLPGPDGGIWVIFNTGKTVARFNPQSGTFESYTLPTVNASLQDLTIGPDNRIWFIGTHAVGSFDGIGGAPVNLVEEPLPSPIFSYQGRSQIIAGPENNLIYSLANSSQIYQSASSGGAGLRDLQVFITYQPQMLLAAGEFTIDAEIVNWTNANATGVEIDLTVDENIHYAGAEIPGGVCVEQAAGARCTLPSLDAGASLPVHFHMTTDRGAVNSRTISLDVSSAEGDYQPANNRVALFPKIQASMDYFNDFSDGADDHWSSAVTSSQAAGLKVLGPFDNEQVTFDWADLPPHDRAWLCFDLYIMGPWTGNQLLNEHDLTVSGPDLWAGYLNDDSNEDLSHQLVYSTFSNSEQFSQSYPAVYRAGDFPSRAGAFAIGEFDGDSTVTDARYQLCYALAHSNPSLKLVLQGSNLDSPADEKWAIDDVNIKVLYDASLHRIYLPGLLR